jgi:hypothetical protein
MRVLQELAAMKLARLEQEVADHGSEAGVDLPSVPMMLRQSPTGSLPLRAEVETSHGYASYH